MAGLNQQQRQEVEDIAELKVRQYFDHYLEKVLPRQIRAHDVNVFAHGGIVRQFARFKYLIMGFAVAGGFGAWASLDKLLAFFH